MSTDLKTTIKLYCLIETAGKRSLLESGPHRAEAPAGPWHPCKALATHERVRGLLQQALLGGDMDGIKTYVKDAQGLIDAITSITKGNTWTY